MYTIGQVAEITGFTTDTLRYYEKIGLLPAAKRKASGVRVYHEQDLETINFLQGLKKTGLSIEEMMGFIQARGFALKTNLNEEYKFSVETKVQILSNHLNSLKEQREKIEDIITLTEKQIAFYKDILEQN